jgi:transitional endoplasmic reticulum ATPase
LKCTQQQPQKTLKDKFCRHAFVYYDLNATKPLNLNLCSKFSTAFRNPAIGEAMNTLESNLRTRYQNVLKNQRKTAPKTKNLTISEVIQLKCIVALLQNDTQFSNHHQIYQPTLQFLSNKELSALAELLQNQPQMLAEPPLPESYSGDFGMKLVIEEDESEEVIAPIVHTPLEINPTKNRDACIIYIGEGLKRTSACELLKPKLLLFLQSRLRQALRQPVQPDSLLERLNVLAKEYGLDDASCDFLLHMFMVQSDSLCEDCYATYMDGHLNFFKNAEMLDLTKFSRFTGIAEADISKVLHHDSLLRRLKLINALGELAWEINNHLSCGTGDSPLHSYYSFWQGDCLGTKEYPLAPETLQILTSLVKNANNKTPMHLLVYGKEGTGKTELSRTLAHICNVRLLQISNPVNHEFTSKLKDESLGFRMRALLAADWFSRSVPTLIVVDEADHLLNELEKGLLNHLLEEIKVPVLWIANHIEDVEESSLRRFQFMVQFRMPGPEIRQKFWKKILQRHQAEHLLSAEETKALARHYSVHPGAVEMAVRTLKTTHTEMITTSAHKILTTVLDSHLEIEGKPLKPFVYNTKTPYNPDVLNIQGNQAGLIATLQSFVTRWSEGVTSAGNNMHVLLYGPPGTGKTEYVRYIANLLERPIVIMRPSEVLGKWVGETEKNIAQAFRDAEHQQAVLFLDEADSLLQSRSGASHSWEVSMVNEFLTQMEQFPGILFCATNHEDLLDSASKRRFTFKLKLDWLLPSGIRFFWNHWLNPLLPNPEPIPSELLHNKRLTPGDFACVWRRFNHLPATEQSATKLVIELQNEILHRGKQGVYNMGFSLKN